MSKLPITVCIIARNEEEHIEQCLKHLKKYDWEIVVTDTGSTDRTREIACEYADKVVDFEWVDDFAAARNHCASFAQNNWILVVDCDEYVTSVDVSALRILMQRYPRYAGVMRLTNLVAKDNGETGYVSDDVPRMYNKHFYQYYFPVHEQICTTESGKSMDSLEAFLLPMEVIHHGYAMTGEAMERKQRRNLDLLQKLIDQEGGSGYHYFQMGQSYFVLGDMDSAISAYEKGLGMADSAEHVYVPELIMSLAKAYCRSDRFPDALELLEKYNAVYDSAKFTYEYANLLRENGRVIKALMLYVKVTTMKDLETLGESRLSCYAYIVDIYRGMGNMEMAELFDQKIQQCVAERERVIKEVGPGRD